MCSGVRGVQFWTRTRVELVVVYIRARLSDSCAREKRKTSYRGCGAGIKSLGVPQGITASDDSREPRGHTSWKDRVVDQGHLDR